MYFSTLADIQQIRKEVGRENLRKTSELVKPKASDEATSLCYEDIQHIEFEAGEEVVDTFCTTSNDETRSTSSSESNKVGLVELRIPLDAPFDQIIETVSVTLLDKSKDSYGQDSICKSRPRLGIENLTYQYLDISFDPIGCIWHGKISYCCSQTRNSVTKLGSKIKISVENEFQFFLQCKICRHTMRKKSSHDLMNNHCTDDDTKMDYCLIDIWSNVNSDKESDSLGAISVTLQHVKYDVARGLYYLNFPDFPEGCGTSAFRSIYQLDKKLGSGAYSTVYQGIHNNSEKQVAVKCIARKHLSPSEDVRVFREVKIQGSLKHQYICPILDFFIEANCYYIVMELMEGGDVFHRIGNLKRYDEVIARNLCKKILEAIEYCHANGIAHCDLKPNNFLLKSKTDHASVMLTDFGFSHYVFASNTLTQRCGTPFFSAPEVVKNDLHDKRADMWSLGVVFYCVLSGKLPFMASRPIDLFKVITNGIFDFNNEVWDIVSDEAKDLISDLLIVDPNCRLTASEALQSRWISDRTYRETSLRASQTNLRNFDTFLKHRTSCILGNNEDGKIPFE